ncbi:hypothetical protein JCM5353_004192 [Sporobolomyces roseus]
MPALSRRDQLKEESGSYVPKLVACFYAVFDPTFGPKILHQCPEGSIATALSTFPSRPDTPNESPSTSSASSINPSQTRPDEIVDSPFSPTTPAVPGLAGAGGGESVLRSTPVLFDFSSVIDFVIPKPELCGHLITKATRTSKILGLPTRIVDEEKYHHSKQVYNRNAFIFNLCFVFERDAELSVYEPVVWKAGRILGQMEQTHSLLSNPPKGEFSMANLLEQMYLDLNAYSETSISLLDTDLSLFLLPFYANPPEVKLWDVPIAVAALESMKSYSWDVTLYKVCSFINGVNHVRKIAELAEVDLYLARMCIQHLVYYNAVILVDLFQFTNSYTVLPDIAEIAHATEEDEEDQGADLRSECENYVFSSTSRDSSPVPFSTLLSFYSQLRPGLTISSWIDDHGLDDLPIDVRRMIQFGVIKGFLRRVYAFPIWLEHPNLKPKSSGQEKEKEKEKVTTGGLKLEISTTGGEGRPEFSRAYSSQGPRTTKDPSLTDHPTYSLPPTRHNSAPDPNLSSLNPLPSRSPSTDSKESPAAPIYPTSLTMMLDGTHHTDEICLKYGIGWRALETVLKHLGGGESSAGEEGGGGGREGEGYAGGEGTRRSSTSNGGGEKSLYGSKVVMIWI